MKRLFIITLCSLCLYSCGAEDHDATLQLPAIVGYGQPDYYMLRMAGTLERIEAPLEYFIDGYEPGEYFCQVQAVYGEQSDYPVNFFLIVTQDNDMFNYEIIPETYEGNFDFDSLILNGE